MLLIESTLNPVIEIPHLVFLSLHLMHSLVPGVGVFLLYHELVVVLGPTSLLVNEVVSGVTLEIESIAGRPVLVHLRALVECLLPLHLLVIGMEAP